MRKLSTPDAAGNTHRVTVALDSQIAEHATSALSPVENDILTARVSLPCATVRLRVSLTRHGLTAGCAKRLRSLPTGLKTLRAGLHQAMRSFEYQAHWLNLLSMLGEQLTVPEVKFGHPYPEHPAIPVDLIDVGNTHTCGVIIEDHGGDANDGLRQTAELQVRSLSEPQFLNEPLFTNRLEFSEARFGKQHFSVESGREMPSSGRPLSAWVMKPASWQCSVWARKATVDFQPASLSVGRDAGSAGLAL